MPRLSDEEVIDALNKTKGNRRKAAKLLNVHATTVGRRANKMALVVPTQEQASGLLEEVADIIYVDKKHPEKMSFDEVIDGFVQAQGFRKKFSFKQLSAKVEIKTNRPIALSFISDVHIGSPHTNYKAVLEDAHKIKKNKQIYTMLGGDITDKMGTFRDMQAVVGQLHPTTLQILTEEKYIDFLGSKMLVKIGGNHDHMDARKSGVDSTYFTNRGKKYPLLPHGGLIKLTVGKVEYKILWKHTYRFKSSLNQFNSHHRMLEILEPTADIVVQEHEHNPGIESLERFQFDSKKTVVNIRTGAYKTDDPFSIDYYKSGRIAPQTVILYPDNRKILALHGKDAINDAEIYLRGHNAK